MTRFSYTLGQRRYAFDDLTALMARASSPKSGDQLAGIAAGSDEERVAARYALADLPLSSFLDEALIPYEVDEVTRLILDGHDRNAFADIAAFTVGELRDWLGPQVAAQPLFVLQMVNNALQVRPPLGLLRDFVKDDGEAGEYPGTIDLKKFGTRPFVDAARIFSLRHGVAASNTADRLRLAAPKMRMHEDEAAAIIEGFHFIQLLRLRNQEGAALHAATAWGDHHHADSLLPPHHPNRIDPDQLNELDRRILKEALRQARKLQSRLELDFKS